MDYEAMTESELKDAIIEKYGRNDKEIYYKTKFPFIDQLIEHDDDPLVQAFDKKATENDKKRDKPKERIFNA